MQSYGHSMGHVLLRPSPRPGQNARCDDENGSAGFWRTLAARLFEYFDYTRHGVGVAALLTAAIVARFQHFQQEFHRRHGTPAVYS
jgi:hypothetical protein